MISVHFRQYITPTPQLTADINIVIVVPYSCRNVDLRHGFLTFGQRVACGPPDLLCGLRSHMKIIYII